MATKPASAKNWVKSHRLLSVLVLALLTLGGFLVYRQYSIAQEKQRFEQARTSIDELYTEIVAIAGEPDKSERSQSCGYASRKFDRGPRSCGVSIRFVYGVKNNDYATSKFELIEEAVYRKTDVFTLAFTDRRNTVPFSYLQDKREIKEVNASITEKSTGMQCSIRYRYGFSNNYQHVISYSESPQNVSVSISCSDNARAEHYPLVD